MTSSDSARWPCRTIAFRMLAVYRAAVLAGTMVSLPAHATSYVESRLWLTQACCNP